MIVCSYCRLVSAYFLTYSRLPITRTLANSKRRARFEPNSISSGFRGTQRIVSVNYLFGRPLIPYYFLKGIFTSNIHDMGNLRPIVFGFIKMSFRVPKKGQLRFSGNGQKCPSNFEKTQVRRE